MTTNRRHRIRGRFDRRERRAIFERVALDVQQPVAKADRGQRRTLPESTLGNKLHSCRKFDTRQIRARCEGRGTEVFQSGAQCNGSQGVAVRKRRVSDGLQSRGRKRDVR